MLYHTNISKYHGEDSKHLVKKRKYIMTTNYCDVACGGCNQLCPNFSKNQIFFIPIEELKNNIKAVSLRHSKIGIYGGEPLRHPQWSEVLETLHSFKSLNFWVMTKHRIQRSKNVSFRADPKNPKANDKRWYVATLIAPQDVLSQTDREYYWNLAKKNCHIWKKCMAIIYQNKAYFCEVAAALDHLFGENHGWPVSDEYPFQKTDFEIAKQAENFCYRCGWALGVIPSTNYNLPRQMIREPAWISKTNARSVKHWRNLKKLTTPECVRKTFL